MPQLVMIFTFVIAVVAIVMAAQVMIAIFGKKKPAAVSPDADERVAHLTAENTALTEQLRLVHDRLETLERIVTDKPSRLEAEIDALKTLSDHRRK